MWRFSRDILLARKKFAPGDPLPGFLADPPMRRYLLARWPGLLYDDAPGGAAPENPDRIKAQQLAASWAEWDAMNARLEPFREGSREDHGPAG